MNTSVTLTADEFREIHNALCFASSKGLEATVDSIRGALAGAYAQENHDFESKHDYYDRFKTDNKLQTIWSIYDTPVHGFLQDHPYPSDAFVCYQGAHVPVFGPSWGDIYRAADWAIRNSGDSHHIFVEHFELKNGNELHLSTGS